MFEYGTLPVTASDGRIMEVEGDLDAEGDQPSWAHGLRRGRAPDRAPKGA